MIDTVARLLDRFVRQDVARANAAQAAIRLLRRRHEVDEVDDDLAERFTERSDADRTRATEPDTDQVRVARSRR